MDRGGGEMGLGLVVSDQELPHTDPEHASQVDQRLGARHVKASLVAGDLGHFNPHGFGQVSLREEPLLAELAEPLAEALGQL